MFTIYFLSLQLCLTDKNACIKCALTVEMGFPLTKMVKVSSFSVVIKFPNQDRLVNSGDDSGVRCTSSAETELNSREKELA